jgi:hypothetical protein
MKVLAMLIVCIGVCSSDALPHELNKFARSVESGSGENSAYKISGVGYGVLEDKKSVNDDSDAELAIFSGLMPMKKRKGLSKRGSGSGRVVEEKLVPKSENDLYNAALMLPTAEHKAKRNYQSSSGWSSSSSSSSSSSISSNSRAEVKMEVTINGRHCSCTGDYRPVCASDGNAYASITCALQCGLLDDTYYREGTCSQVCPQCTAYTGRYLCDRNRIRYFDSCFAGCFGAYNVNYCY